jgi:hypothetical protein
MSFMNKKLKWWVVILIGFIVSILIMLAEVLVTR